MNLKLFRSKVHKSQWDEEKKLVCGGRSESTPSGSQSASSPPPESPILPSFSLSLLCVSFASLSRALFCHPGPFSFAVSCSLHRPSPEAETGRRGRSDKRGTRLIPSSCWAPWFSALSAVKSVPTGVPSLPFCPLSFLPPIWSLYPLPGKVWILSTATSKDAKRLDLRSFILNSPWPHWCGHKKTHVQQSK